MKKCILSVITILCLSSCSLGNQYRLDKMGELVKQHIKYRDIDNNTITKIEYLQPVSYEKIPEDKRSDPKEEYVCKIYMRGTWAYADSYRIYNINDTINCYFDKGLKVLRINDKSVNSEQ